MKQLTPTERFEMCVEFSKTCYMKGLCTKEELDKALKFLKKDYINEMIADFNESSRQQKLNKEVYGHYSE